MISQQSHRANRRLGYLHPLRLRDPIHYPPERFGLKPGCYDYLKQREETLRWCAPYLPLTSMYFKRGLLCFTDLPTLPQAEVDTTYSLPTGTTHNCSTSAEFSTALSNAALNDVIVLTAGNTFTGPFTYPNKTSGNGWIYIISSALASLPAAGTRVAPADSSNMPKIVVTAASAAPALSCAISSHHLRIVGVEFKPTASNFVFTLVELGLSGTVSSTSQLPTNIVLDRCYIHGDSSVGSRRGIQMNGIDQAAVDCYISDFKESGSDTQAIHVQNGLGPLKIHNCYLEASGENFLSGGAAPSIENLIPSDITITRCKFFKPLSWVGVWTIKNLCELKSAQRVLIQGCDFENNWLHAQNGECFVLTPRAQAVGWNEWANVLDVTIRYCKALNTGTFAVIAGEDSDDVSGTPARFLIEHCLHMMDDTEGQGASRRIFHINNSGSDGPDHITIRHNTGIFKETGGTNTAIVLSELFHLADQVDIYDNLLDTAGDLGINSANGGGNGTAALDAHITNWTATNNAFIGISSTGYPSGNFFPADFAAVEFVNAAADNYRLDPASDFAAGNANDATDGTDLGANIDDIEDYISGALPASGGGGQTGDVVFTL